MKAVKILGTSQDPIITFTTHDKPTPQHDSLLIKVHAAGITADEVNWPELYKTSSRIPGHDISGVVEAVGPGYSGEFKVCDEVFAMINADSEGGQAEYAVVAASEVARKPSSLTHEQAAALPIPVLTAVEMMQKAGKAGRALVTGASGAVGRILVQIAEGEVVALASEKNHADLRQLGVKECIDYNTDWLATVNNVDVALDTAGGDMLKKCWSAVKKDGVIVTIGDPIPDWAFDRCEAEEAKEFPGVKYIFFIVTASGEELGQVARLIDEGKVKPLPVMVFDAQDAAEAWKHAAQRGRKGKVVIKFV